MLQTWRRSSAVVIRRGLSLPVQLAPVMTWNWSQADAGLRNRLTSGSPVVAVPAACTSTTEDTVCLRMNARAMTKPVAESFNLEELYDANAPYGKPV